MGAVLVVTLAAGVGFVGAANFGSDTRDASVAVSDGEKRLAELGAETKRRTDALAELERRSAVRESELADNTMRVAQLEQRKRTLEREIAELVAPVAVPEADRDQDGEREIVALAPSDPSPPDEVSELRAPKLEAGKADAASSGPVRGGEAWNDSSRVEQKNAAPTAQRAHSSQGAQVATPQDFGGATRVFIHVRSADPAARERAVAVAAELRRRGVAVAEIRGVRYPVRQDSVRYFYDADRAAISALQEAVRQASTPGGPAPKAQDYRDFRAPPRQGTLELWLS